MLQIRKAREAKGMTRVDLAEALKKSKWTIQSWELGRKHPRVQDLDRIAEVLGVSTKSLFGGE